MSEAIKSSMGNSPSHRITRLDEHNYLSWEAQMRFMFRAKGLWETVEGTEVKPVRILSSGSTGTSAPDNPDFDQRLTRWTGKANDALYLIITSVSPSLVTYIK